MALLTSDSQEVLRALAEQDAVIAVDTETTGLRVSGGFDYAIGLSFATVLDGVPHSYYAPLRHASGQNLDEETASLLRAALTRPGHTLLFCNAQFDLRSLRSVEIDVLDHNFIDVASMAHFINENFPFEKSLEELSRHYLKDGKLIPPKWEDWATVTPEEMEPYATKDAELTYRLWYVLKDHENWLSLPELVWEDKQKLMRVLVAMKEPGVRIDQELAQRYVEMGEQEMERIRTELGYKTIGPKALQELFLDVFGLPVVKETPQGKPSFDKEAMGIYDKMLEKIDRREAKLIKEYRGWQKAVSAAYRPYLELLDPDGRLRCSYKTEGTVTGRLSCSKPNLQQIPKESDKPWNGKVKECFIGEEGYVLINADFSQLELRLGTAYAGEETLKEVFNQDRDIFSEMAAAMGMTRQDTKTFVYSTQYGAGRNRISKALDVSEEKAEAMLRNYGQTYPRFRAFNERCTARAERDKRIRTWTGRERHFRFANEGYKAMNSVIQGGAADIVERIMIRAYEELHGEDCRMLLQVHDSITFEVKIEKVQEYLPRIKAVMEDVNAVSRPYEVEFDVRFAVDVGFWSEREERVYNEAMGITKEAA